jgi:hypothetical protein
MITKTISALLVLSMICLFSPTCRNKEDVELIKSQLNSAINESNRLETAGLLDRLLRLGVDPKTLPVVESADLIMGKVFRAYNWETITGDELVQLYGPLEGTQNGTYREHLIRAAYFWGLMETGRRKKALSLWAKSEQAVSVRLASPRSLLRYHLKLPREEMALLNGIRGSVPYFTIGFISSKDPEDRLRGVELAKRNQCFLEDSLKEDVSSIQLANPIAQAQIARLIMDESLLPYSLVESGLALDPAANPFLGGQPDTTIRFRLVGNSGFEGCGLRTAADGYNRIVLGDFDDDGYADVLVPDQGLWRNLGGGGRFERVDKELGLDIKGTSAAFADVNNDGLVDVIVAGKDKFGVSLQTQGRMFRPVLGPAEGVTVNAAAIGLFDGDADGLIDVFLARSEDAADGKTVVLCNKGDGTFEDVTKEWEFSGNDVLLPGEGVSPGDYDGDGRTDIFVANYRASPNTLWHNVSEGTKTTFIQCAAAPWFGTDKRPEIPVGLDRGVEGWRTERGGTSYWGHTSGAAWGDLNGDGTLDLVYANLAHPNTILLNPPMIFDLSRVYLNTAHTFVDHTIDSGLVYRETNTDPLLADFNNDGHLDLSITNCYRVWVNQLYEGGGDGSFREVTFRTGAFASNSQGQAAADFDNDGDLDWFVFDGNKGLLVYENKLIDGGKIPPAGNWIELKLHGGKHANGMAFGARVTVMTNEKSYVREVAGMRGWSNCDDPVIHIGLGEYPGKVNVKVQWLGDRIQEFSGLDVNKRHELYEIK